MPGSLPGVVGEGRHWFRIGLGLHFQSPATAKIAGVEYIDADPTANFDGLPPIP